MDFKSTYLALIILFCTQLAKAQFTYNFIEIDSRKNVSSNPYSFTEYQNKVYFYASDSAHGRELWVTDGTTANLVKDIYPGKTNGVNGFRNQNNMCVVGNDLFINGTLPYYGHSVIYKYNGIDTPTIIDKIYDEKLGNIQELVTDGTHLYFHAFDSAGQRQIIEYAPQTNALVYITDSSSPYHPTSSMEYLNGTILFDYEVSLMQEEVCMYDIQNNTFSTFDTTKPEVPNSIGGGKIINNRLYLSDTKNIIQFDGTTFKDIANNVQLGTYYTGGISFSRPYTSINAYVYLILYSNPAKPYNIYQYDPATDQYSLMAAYSLPPLMGYKNKIYKGTGKNFSVYDFKNPDTSVIDLDPNLYVGPNIQTDHIASNGWLFYAGLNFNDTVPNVELVAFHDSTVSVPSQLKPIVKLIAYPNPVTDIVHLNIYLDNEQKLSIQLTNINGQLLYQKEEQLYSVGKHDITIPMQELPTGTYIYSIKDDNGTVINSGKLLKQ